MARVGLEMELFGEGLSSTVAGSETRRWNEDLMSVLS